MDYIHAHKILKMTKQNLLLPSDWSMQASATNEKGIKALTRRFYYFKRRVSFMPVIYSLLIMIDVISILNLETILYNTITLTA